jgi:two-component system LytT family sensor kinase
LLSFRHIRPAIPVILLLCAGIALAMFYTPTPVPIPQELLLTDLLASLVLLGLTAWGLLQVIRIYPTRVGMLAYALLLALLFSAAFTLADMYLLKWMGPDDGPYPSWLMTSVCLRFVIAMLSLGWVATLYALRLKTSQLEAEFRLQADAASLLREAELFKLRQQLQPHFLYNSLNAINALIMSRPEQAMEMTARLSDFLRSSVRREARDLIPVDEELAYIETYLSIEAVRFGDRLQVQYNSDYPKEALIPSFLLQPLLENAIRFGLYGRTGTVAISVDITHADAMLQIRITNPFDPAVHPASGTGFGLEGVRRRLYLLYARTDLLELQQDQQTFTVILKIPQ